MERIQSVNATTTKSTLKMNPATFPLDSTRGGGTAKIEINCSHICVQELSRINS